MRSILLGLTALLMTACNGPGGDGSGTDEPTTPRGRGDDCGEHSPVIDQFDVTVGDPRWYETETGRQCLPTVVITVAPTDEDGDLTYYKMDVWFDEIIDERVLAEGEFSRIEGSIEGEDCGVESIPGLSMLLGIAGGGGLSPSFDTETEFGVVVHDDQDNESNDGTPVVRKVVTPSAALPGACD